MDAEEHFKSLNDKQKCSIIDLQNEIGKLKNEKERQIEEIKEKDFLYKLNSNSYTEEIVKLSKLKDGMKKEIETLKKQISEQEAEIRQHEFSQLNKELGLDIGRNGIKPEQSWSLSMPFFFHQQESVRNQPEEEIQEKTQKNMFEDLDTSGLEEDPADSETKKQDNNEEENKALSEALEVLSNTKKETSELIERTLSLEKEKQQLEGQLKKTKAIKIKLEENQDSFETEKMMIHMQLEAAKQDNHNLKKSNEDESKALKEALEDLSKMEWKLEECAKDFKETLSQKKKETLEMIDRNETLKKVKEEMEEKFKETNERRRKLEENIEGFENEKKRSKLQLAAANNENENLRKSQKESHAMLSMRDEKLKEKEKVIARQKFNLKTLLANIDKLKT